jgi:beta-lactamase class A
MKRALLIVAAAGLLPAQQAEPRLDAALRALEARSGGVLGVAALHLESGRLAGWRAKEHFPMMSVAKLPVAVRALSLMQAGLLPYRKMIRIEPQDYSSGFSPLRDRYPQGAVVTVGQLIEASVRDSDNSAHDILLRLCGGPEATRKQLDRLFQGAIGVHRSEHEMNADFETLGAKAFDADGRDSATPEAMVLLLSAIHSRKLLHPASHERLIRWMTETATGPRRIKGQLPPGVSVWHKTGTGGTKDGVNLCTNDVGVVELPGGKGHLALAVFVKLSTSSLEEREQAIAGTARLFYDYFTSLPLK